MNEPSPPDIGNKQHLNTAPVRSAASFRPDVEGLRAIAILLVVAFHIGTMGLGGGFVGVDVFFVLSGYLITGLLLDEIEKTGRIHILGFYGRRARRLLPAAALMIVATVVTATILLSPAERQLYAKTAIAAGAYASNFWFEWKSAGYFDADVANNPLLHTWSLAVEEQFYLIWPFLMVAVWSQFRSRRALVVSLFLLSFVSFAVCLWLVAAHPVAAFYFSPARAWEFGVGGLAALVPTALLERLRSYGPVIGLTGFLGIILAAITFSADKSSTSVAMLLPVMGAAAVLVSGKVPAKFGIGRLLSLQPLLYIGRLSYSWYLWHWPVLVLAAVILPDLSLLGRAVAAVFALGIAALSYLLVEAPIRFNRYLVGSVYASIALAIVMTLTTAGTSGIAWRLALNAADTPQQRLITAARVPVAPALAARGCFVSFEGTQSPDCVFGDASSATTIVLFGDSHAAQWFSAFESIADEQRWRLVVLTKMGCPTLSVDIRVWTMKNVPYQECSSWRASALNRILTLKPALVVLSNSDNHVTSPSKTASQRLSLEQWRDGTRVTLGMLNAAGIQTAILRDTPGPGPDIPTCLSRADVRHLSPGVCAVARPRAIREDVFRASSEAAAGLPNVAMLDLTNYICTADICPPTIGGVIVYGQPGHIAFTFGRTLEGAITRQILPLMAR